MREMTRRGFIAGAVLALPIPEGCGDSIVEPAVPASSPVELSAATIRIRLPLVPALAVVGGALVIGQANVIVLHTGAREYRALSNICTHAGCGISQFVDQRLRCQCHGSEFGIDGADLVGPATEPFATFPSALVDDGRMLVINRPGA